MNPAKVKRNSVIKLTDLPNVGPSIAGDLELIGIKKPTDLKGKDAYKLYQKLCRVTKQMHDPCVLDVFISITRFMDGEEPRPWWDYTEERKQFLLKKRLSK